LTPPAFEHMFDNRSPAAAGKARKPRPGPG
jgi:hypothetical protein